jgi:hypothetical protein
VGEVENYPLLKIEINVDCHHAKEIMAQLKLRLDWEEPLVNILKLCNNELDAN